jgi:predicted acyltransferase
MGFRIMGVMQRLALCYLMGSFGFLFFSQIYYHIAFLAGCIAIYVGFMYGYKVPAFNQDITCGRGKVDIYCNFGAYLDRSIFGTQVYDEEEYKYMFAPTDPEGVFTTITAFINVFAGMFYSFLMRYNTKVNGSDKISLLLYWSLLTTVFILIGFEIPAFGDEINKKRWSVSFAFLTSGISGAALCLCFICVDLYNKPWVKDRLI